MSLDNREGKHKTLAALPCAPFIAILLTKTKLLMSSQSDLRQSIENTSLGQYKHRN